ncbi:aminotransferase class III-fold pyridoxal phosphate-dependent enzyme [Maribacter algicola]|uniref:Aminotransferase class III-fold pyridoxal phosphate-dependent enzyme n=1 Tax=Meishania litoralis TaxID=3434685 RepID=A0ACC7LKX9_9FLAO
MAENIVLEHFGMNCGATALPGEIDFNFRIKAKVGKDYILKISRPGEDDDYLDFQQKLLLYIADNGENLIAPKVVSDLQENVITTITDAHGKSRKVRLLTWVSGRLWSTVNPQLDDLRKSLGEHCGKLTKALQGFDHPQAHREFDWDIAQSLWTKNHLNLFKGKEKDLILFYQQTFEALQKSYSKLRKGVVHNDANDNNIIVSDALIHPHVVTTIDYGDSCHTQVINDLAVACAYGIMGHNNPLEASLSIVKGYHEQYALTEGEIEHLYWCIAMRLVISVTKSAINKIKEPDNAYLQISERPAWELLMKWKEISPEFALFSFRQACGFSVHPDSGKFEKWAAQNRFSLTDLFPTVDKNKVHHLDLSVSSKWIGHREEFNDLEFFQFKIDRLQKEYPDRILAGGYLEPRPLYTSTEYDKVGNSGPESRTIHLGIDFWLPEKTPVHALFDGEVVIAVNDAGDKEYGGLLILRHELDGFGLYSLYGHLTVASVSSKKVGQRINKGECIGHLGNYPENGNWVSHLHFQLMHSLLDNKKDFPGVTYPKQKEVWQGLCPDPNLLFKLKELAQKQETTNQELIDYRRKHLGKSLSLQYKNPIKIVRGEAQYLLDQYGQKYLDTVNNVAHVGHENYKVVKAGQEQMALLNTNSRYLHDQINILAQELLQTLPQALNVVHFVNSGSEANELAMRMVKAATGLKDIIASEVGYHGNTNMCIDISSYKFDGKGGKGAPEHTHIIPLPDAFRGKYRGFDSGSKYAEEVQLQIDAIHKKNRKPAAFIIEPIISCGGQIELPNGFLDKAYDYVRRAGGLCISDEVQVGCGRMGKTFWGFQLYDVVPDIITMGKPLGNGHPLAAVVCTQEVAEKFANGMEYFNTFGGNPVSCAIGSAVLQTVKNEGLRKNAQLVGEFLKVELKALAEEFPIIGDVRGQGLFLGIELVDSKKNPLPDQTDYLVDRMKDHHVLMSIDGPDHNVLKIKPPLVFTQENARELLCYLKKILAEDFMKSWVD